MLLTRKPAVNGMFYPADAQSIRSMLLELLETGRSRISAMTDLPAVPPKAVIVPHAGWVYSGEIAALAYSLVAPIGAQIKKVAVFAPSHHVFVDGLATSPSSAWETPLGTVPVNYPQHLSNVTKVVSDDAAHAQEHSIEVQLPFLQTVIPEFTIAPFSIGRADPERVADVIIEVWGGRDTLIVVSTDLSHYHPYDEARQIDAATVDQILALDSYVSHQQACGATPLNGMLVAAKRLGLDISLLGHCNSGDTAHNKSKVVGYGAFCLYQRADL